MADQVAVAIDNARKFSEEATLLEATDPLFRIGHRLTAATSTDDVVQSIVDSVTETEADGCAVASFDLKADGEVQTITFLRSWRRTGTSHFPEGPPLPASASMFPLPMLQAYWVVEDVPHDTQMAEEVREALSSLDVQAVINIPLRAGDKAIGFVIVERFTPGPFAPVSIRLYETMADQAAMALERARLLEEAQRRADRERTVREVADQMQRAADMEALMRIAAEELNRALGGSRAYVRLSTEAQLLAGNDGPAGERDD
jgi:GAF domain-containing protein